MAERLSKFLALHLGISRREADAYIERANIEVNGKTAELGMRYEEGDVVTFRGKPVKTDTDLQYLILNKPTGYVCSRRAQGDNPTIYTLLPEKYHNLKPVGRLDKDSSGIILLTNDGDFAHSMTHPKFVKTKVYKVALDKDLEPLHQQMISDYGITLDDGVSKLHLTRLNDANRSEWIVTMSEGRNRQIRRTFLSLGYTVVRLHRTNFGNYSLGDIKPREFKIINIS